MTIHLYGFEECFDISHKNPGPPVTTCFLIVSQFIQQYVHIFKYTHVNVICYFEFHKKTWREHILHTVIALSLIFF